MAFIRNAALNYSRMFGQKDFLHPYHPVGIHERPVTIGLLLGLCCAPPSVAGRRRNWERKIIWEEERPTGEVANLKKSPGEVRSGRVDRQRNEEQTRYQARERELRGGKWLWDAPKRAGFRATPCVTCPA